MIPVKQLIYKKTICIIGLLFMWQLVVKAQTAVIPQPLSMRITSEQMLAINSGMYIVYDAKLSAGANLLSQEIKKITGISVKLSPIQTKTTVHNTIYLKLEKATTPDAESYRLQINDNGVMITASNAAGIFYGGVTLQQLLNQQTKDKNQWQLPFVDIDDKPCFSWRGLMLDCSRTFLAPGYLKKTIDRMSFYKMNVLHLHLTDDQGWRLEIKKYPLLIQKGASFDKKYNEPKEYQGFYTQEQIKDLVSYAQNRHVQIIPEIECPGHSIAALNAYPQLSCTGNIAPLYPFFAGPDITKDIFCAGNKESYLFYTDVMKEVAALFPSSYVHLGGDEVPKTRWHNCIKCQAKMKELNIEQEEKLQSYLMDQVHQALTSDKKRPIGWDEIMEGAVSKDWVVMVWRDQQTGIKAAREGYDVVMTPTSHLYFDYDYSTTNTEKVYSFQPVPAKATAEEKKHYLGIQANFWSHIDRTESKIDFPLFPSLLALAERAWSDESVNDTITLMPVKQSTFIGSISSI